MVRLKQSTQPCQAPDQITWVMNFGSCLTKVKPFSQFEGLEKRLSRRLSLLESGAGWINGQTLIQAAELYHNRLSQDKAQGEKRKEASLPLPGDRKDFTRPVTS